MAVSIANIEQTCNACPSQWEGRLSDDRPFYIRYRWGRLTVSVGEPGGSLDSAVMAKDIVDETLGGEWDGFIDVETVLPIMMKALEER